MLDSVARVVTTMKHEYMAIRHAIDIIELQHGAIRHICSFLSDNGGKVAVTGMGKIGYVGARFAMTLASTGTPAFFLHPGEAQHGDLGMLTEQDILIACSNSGKTREVYETIAQARIAFPLLPIITVSGHCEPEMTKYADVSLEYGKVLEACPLGLTPSSSLAVVSALLDGIAFAVMEQNNFTIKDYAKRHHGGYLGVQARQGSYTEQR